MAAWLAMLACALPGHAAACSTAGWDAVTTNGSAAQVLVVGSPTDTTPVPRYSGPCAAMARAPGNYVTDTISIADWAYHSRFYAFVDVPGGDIEFFRASNASNETIISIRLSGTTFKFINAAGAITQSAVVTPGRWYAFELDWYAGNNLTVELRGAGASAQPRLTAGTSNNTERIKQVSLGWISGAGTGSVVIDAYAYRRLTGWDGDIPIGRVCRGLAGGFYYPESPDASLSPQDMVLVRNEIAGLGLVAGQPDCDENGVINSADTTCIASAIIRDSPCH